MNSMRELSIEEIDRVSGAISYWGCIGIATSVGAFVGALTGGPELVAGAIIGFGLGYALCRF